MQGYRREFDPVGGTHDNRGQTMNTHLPAIKALRCFLLVFAGWLFAPLSAAQDLNAAEKARVRQAIGDSVTSISSYNGVAEMPRHELYLSLFTEILIAPESAHGFTSADWEIIANLPSHSDRRFRAVTDKEMETFCNFVQSEKRASVAAAVEIAAHYEKAKEATDELLGRHYDEVIAALSERGRAALRQRVESMNDRMELVHTNIDVRILAQSAPEYTIRMLKSGCVRTQAAYDANPARSVLLSEELLRNANIGAVSMETEPESRNGQ